MMQRNAKFVGRPVAGLQEVLRTLSVRYPEIPPKIPNGRFDADTLEGVMVFQRERGLPVTGRVEQDTWSALAEDYREAVGALSPTPLYPGGDTTLQMGQEAPVLYPIQGMFCALSGVLGNFQHEVPTGRFGEVTAANTRALQRCAGMEETGRFDRAAWVWLNRVYETFLMEI